MSQSFKKSVTAIEKPWRDKSEKLGRSSTSKIEKKNNGYEHDIKESKERGETPPPPKKNNAFQANLD